MLTLQQQQKIPEIKMDDNSLPEPAPIKKEHSYTYWVDEKNKSKDLPVQQRPVKVQAPVLQVKKENGPSAWNKIGTWEEKKVPILQLQQTVNARLVDWLEKSQLTDIQLHEVNLEGEAHSIYKRNKWRMMYELSGSIKFKSEEKQGQIKLIELTDSGDRQYSIKGDSEVNNKLEKQKEVIMGIVESVIESFNN